MHDAFRVQVLQRGDNVRQVELGSLEVEAADSLEKRAEITSLHVLHDHVEVLAALKRVDATDDEVVVDLVEHVTLIDHKLLHVLLNHHCLVEHFDREDVVRLLLSREHDLAVGPARDRLEQDEVLNRHTLSILVTLLVVKLAARELRGQIGARAKLDVGHGEWLIVIFLLILLFICLFDRTILISIIVFILARVSDEAFVSVIRTGVSD